MRFNQGENRVFTESGSTFPRRAYATTQRWRADPIIHGAVPFPTPVECTASCRRRRPRVSAALPLEEPPLPRPRLVALFAAGLAIALASALPAAAQVTVTNPWARAVVPGQKTTGAVMRLTAA